MNADLECPYCNASLEVCHDDGFGYDEDKAHEMECDECGKNFVFQTHISFTYFPEKADCLNGSPHQFKDWQKLWSRDGDVIENRRCRDCDHVEQRTRKISEANVEATHGCKPLSLLSCSPLFQSRGDYSAAMSFTNAPLTVAESRSGEIFISAVAPLLHFHENSPTFTTVRSNVDLRPSGDVCSILLATGKR